MASLVVRPPVDISFDWNPMFYSGWPQAKSRMIALVGPFSSLTYAFPFTPIESEYSSLANEYVQIERPGNYALIDRKAPQLTQVSFSFLVVDRASQGLVSVENQILFLNQFASANAPIAFVGMGGLLGRNPEGVYRLWRVNNFTIGVRRKTPNNEVSQAECQMTVIEDRNPDLPTATLPRITYTKTVPKKSTKEDDKRDDVPDPGKGYPDAADTGSSGDRPALGVEERRWWNLRR